MKPPGANEPLVISFTDSKVQSALDELAASAGDDAATLRAVPPPPAGNALSGLLRGARTLTEKGRSEAADARGVLPRALPPAAQQAQHRAGHCLQHACRLSRQAVRNTLTAVNSLTQPALASLPHSR